MTETLLTPSQTVLLDELVDIAMEKLGENDKDRSPGHHDAVRAQMAANFKHLGEADLKEAISCFSTYTKNNINFLLALLVDNVRLNGYGDDVVSPESRCAESMFIITSLPVAMEFAVKGVVLTDSSNRLVKSATTRFPAGTDWNVLRGYAVDQMVRGSFGKDNPYSKEHLEWVGINVERLIPHARMLQQHGSLERGLCDDLLTFSPSLAEGVL